MAKSPSIDAYILKAQPFAQDIIIYLRAIIHSTCKDVEETLKWGMPTFTYKGKIVCGIAAFKAHAAFGFWLAPAMQAYSKDLNQDKTAMGDYGKLTRIEDLPNKKIIVEHIKLAVQLIDKGVNNPKLPKKEQKEIPLPDALLQALKKNKTAENKFNAFSPSHRREYLLWITEAKTEATRNKRIAQTIEWVAQGKGRNWKYENKK